MLNSLHFEILYLGINLFGQVLPDYLTSEIKIIYLSMTYCWHVIFEFDKKSNFISQLLVYRDFP